MNQDTKAFFFSKKEFIPEKSAGSLKYLTILLIGCLSLLINSRYNLADVTTGTPQFSRIISLAPSDTEILFALGLGEKIIGVTKFCNYPPEARRKHRVGGYMDLNFEAIISLNPDLVIATPSQKQTLAKLARLNITTLAVSALNLAQIYQSIRTIGNHTGCAEQAQTLVRRIQSQIIPCKTVNPVGVMLVVGRSAGSLPGLYVSGGDSFLSELLEIAGGRNIFRNLSGYRQPSLEEIISLNPAIIIEIRNNEPLSEAKKTALKGDWHILHTVDAVINDRILIWTQPFLTIPGPRITAIYDKFKEVCHASAVP